VLHTTQFSIPHIVALCNEEVIVVYSNLYSLRTKIAIWISLSMTGSQCNGLTVSYSV
jgi:hypothetical protein